MNPVNSFTFPSNKTATQSHSQANMLFWLDFLCDNLVYPCNTPAPGQTAPAAGRGPPAQINLTDEQSRIMPVAGGGFEQCYNAQAVVAAGSLLAADVCQATNDKRQLAPMLGKLAALPADLGKPETLLADTGYFSAANVQACGAAGIEPLIALGREAHHPSLSERFAEAPPAPDDPTVVEAMAHRLKTREGRKLYAQRKHTA